MNAQVENILVKLTAILLFAIINFIGIKAFSATEYSAPVPTCQLASEGYVQDQWMNIRIQVNNAIVAGAETLSGLVHQLTQLALEHKCQPTPVPCELAPEGLAVGAWVKHRIMIQDVAAFGANTTARVFEQLGQLKKIGVCE